jgi:hypothetical protein
VLLVILSASWTQAGSRRPGARPPTGMPPGVAPRHAPASTSPDLSSVTPPSTQQQSDLFLQTSTPSVSTSSTGTMPTSLGNRTTRGARVGSRPDQTDCKLSAPKHLIGDPPAWGGYLGTFLYQTQDPGDARPLLPGEVNVYTGPFESSLSPDSPAMITSQWVINWNPHSGLVRQIYYYTVQAIDPSTIYWYLYSTPSNPTTSTSSSDNRISLSQAYTALNWSRSNSQDGGLLTTPSTANPSSTQATSGETSYVVYGSSSTNPALPRGDQLVSLTSFSPEDFADDSASPTVPLTGPSEVTPQTSSITALADSEAFTALTSASVPKSPSPLSDMGSLSPIGIPIDGGAVSQGATYPNTQASASLGSVNEATTEKGPSVVCVHREELGDSPQRHEDTKESKLVESSSCLCAFVVNAFSCLRASREVCGKGTKKS